MSNPSKNIGNLSPEQLELLVQQAAKKRKEAARSAAIPPQPRTTNSFPMSFAQQRLWFIDQLTPNNTAYNIHQAMRLTGPLNVTALQQSLNEIVRRHETLRTGLELVDGRAVQVIVPPGIMPLPVMNLVGLSGPERDSEVQRMAVEEARQPFDLKRGHLFRAKLLRLADAEHVLLLTMHHIISDSWSIAVFVRELSALYGTYCTGKPAQLPELPIQYADFAVWQHEPAQKAAMETQLAYWKRQLGGSLPVLDLITDRPRPPVQTFNGARMPLALPAELHGAVTALSRREGVTLFMTLLAAFQVLLYRYTSQEDCIVGSPIANRGRPELEGLIGFFANTLALRTDLSGNPTFRELLARVRQVCQDAYAHQDVPFDRLVEELHPERDLSRNPIFQTVFVLQNTLATSLDLAGLTSRPLFAEGGTALFDLMLDIIEVGGRLGGSLEYNTDLYDAATIHRFGEHFRILLEGLAADPDRRIADVPLLTDDERRQLVAWNTTRTAFPRDAAIHELFEIQAERTPGATALLFEDQQLSYGDLNRRANQLAHHLRARGVGPEVPVGICMERSLDTVVGILGILKAGGTYVPLDPTYPPERLAFMLSDTGVSTVLTQQRLTAELARYRTRLICLDTDWERIAREPMDNPPNRSTAANLAYVMYTSGSTGQPKGTCIPHRAVVRLVMATNYASFSDDEVFLLLAPITFDASTLELWGSLLHGARLVIFPPHTPTLDELGAFIKQHRITTLWLTAGLFHQMVEHNLASLTQVRQLLAGGDVLSVPHVQKVLKAQGRATLINGYGPTENTTFTCCYPITDPNQLGRSVPIGRPIANTQVYVLDRQLRPTPAGVPGELYIGGDGLARGYLNRPELTAERFVPNPFQRDEGARMKDEGSRMKDEGSHFILHPSSFRLYRTGDRARWRPDGTIEFLGRLDNQVKIRGFRIELGEIEVNLARHPAVRDAVVQVRTAGAGDKRLVGYIVPQSGQEPAASELRAFLKTSLPEYMLPATFVLLDELPLTHNGKVDYRALPAPDSGRPDMEQGYVAPRTPEEQSLARIWADVLSLQKVGIYDNFFELGGHSLLATQVMARVRETFQVDLPLISLYEGPTIADMATVLVQQQVEQADGGSVAQVLSQLEDLSEAEAQTLLVTQAAPTDAADGEDLDVVLNQLEQLSDDEVEQLLVTDDLLVDEQADPDELALLLAELENLSDEEAQTLLDPERK